MRKELWVEFYCTSAIYGTMLNNIILLKESSEWHNVDDGYESGIGQCQLESSPEFPGRE
jgi:hypothetical protein